METTPRELRVLFVEDTEEDADLVLRELRRVGWAVTHERVETREDLVAALRQKPWDLVLADYLMPTFDGLSAVQVVRESGLDVPVIIVSGTIGEDTAVTALQAGAADFVVKGRLARLAPAIERELREKAVRDAQRKSEARAVDMARRAQRMEAVATLAGGVAHDFNNLLSVILTYTDLLLLSAAEDDPNREDLTEVRRAAERATDLTRQLLAFSRQQMLQPRVLDLNAVVTGMEKNLRRLVGGGQELVLVLSPRLGKVLADPGQIEHVLVNLVVNAREAMGARGKATLETDDVQVDASHPGAKAGVPPGEYVVLTVADTGRGMDAATLERIFDPFFTTKERGSGTGLGLSTVLGIVKQSGGHVTVDSAPGQGTTFRLFFPRSGERAPGPITAAPPPVTLRGTETILLVDDDDAVRASLRATLRRYGYEVLEAQNGGEAFLLCERTTAPIHLLVTDMVMPRMSGRELAERLAPMRPSMQVLYVSGFAETGIVKDGVVIDGVFFLPKPVTPDVLLRKVREILDAPPPGE